MTDAAGWRIGPYQILRSLSAGGMGEIYHALDTRLDREVAIKFLSEHLAKDPLAIDRFIREARAASALNHPNIVTIYEAGEHEGRRFIVMEFIKGKTLGTLLSEHQLPLSALPDIAGQIGRALSAAHAAGLIHRDIKPENVMVRNDGYVKVVDFGIARQQIAEVDTTDLTRGVTRSGTVIGTPRYMSPEQVKSEKLTSASDIFSFGLLLYEWATARHPFEADSAISMMHAITSESPLAAARLNPDVPAALDSLLLEMLQRDASRRPSAVEIVERLGQIAAGATGKRMAAPGVERRIVGRISESAQLRTAFETVARGRGQLVGVSGEPGIGKTALVENILHELVAGETPGYFAHGRCSERFAGTEAYLPFLEALDSLLRREGHETVGRIVKALAPAWCPHLALVPDTVEVQPKKTRAGSRERLTRQLAAALEELARLRPLVMFFDDLHWADMSTIDLLAYLAARFDRMRILIIATYRPSELRRAGHPFLAVMQELQGRGLAREIALGFLGEDDVGHYLALQFPNHVFPAAFRLFIHDRTEGNPFFMVDLLNDLRDSGTIVRQDEGWGLVRAVPEIAREVPASIRSMIQRKIDALDEEDRRYLVAASVQGISFDTAIVATVLKIDPAAVEDRLDVLERVHGFVRFVGETSLPDGTASSQYRFVHALYQNSLYESLRPVRRAALSSDVGHALVTFYRGDATTIAAELAFLFEAAHDALNAARYFLAASQKTARVYAHGEAVLLGRRGVQILGTLPETPARAQLELDLQLVLGLSLTATKGYAAPEVEQAYTRARTLCQHATDAVHRFRVLEGLWRFYTVKPDLAMSATLAEQLLDLGRSADNDELVALAHTTFGTPYLHRCNFTGVLEHLEQALALYDPGRCQRYIDLTGADFEIRCHSWAALTLWLRGYSDRAYVRLERTLTRSSQISHPFSRAFALSLAAWHCHFRREPAAVQEHAEAALAVATEHALGQWVPVAFILRGWALAEQGRPQEGLDFLRRGLDMFKATGAELNRPHFLSMLAEAYWRQGQPEDGILVLDEALALAERNHDCYWKSEIVRLKGTLLLSASRPDGDAEACFHDAIKIARQQQARLLELRAVTSLSRLWQRQNRSTEAIAALTAACDWFTEGFDSFDLREAKLHLSELSTAR
jgi:predicted ATPase